MIRYCPLLLVLTALLRPSGFATPLEDLASPLQAVRDEAALALRKSYQSIPETKWLPTLEKIKQGKTKAEILELLRPFNVTPAGGAGSGQSHSESYRLDDAWILVCWYQNQGDILIDRKLDPSIRPVWVAPPNDFTGTWITYFINGQKNHEINYKDGHCFGESIAYHANGARSLVMHYDGQSAHGEDTGYYPSGKVYYRGQYQNGKPIGTCTWYAEDVDHKVRPADKASAVAAKTQDSPSSRYQLVDNWKGIVSLDPGATENRVVTLTAMYYHFDLLQSMDGFKEAVAYVTSAQKETDLSDQAKKVIAALNLIKVPQ